jgi:hypothetical protein
MPYIKKEQGSVIYEEDGFTIYEHGWDMVGQCVGMTPPQIYSVKIHKLGITLTVTGHRSQHRARQMCLDIGQLYS